MRFFAIFVLAAALAGETIALPQNQRGGNNQVGNNRAGGGRGGAAATGAATGASIIGKACEISANQSLRSGTCVSEGQCQVDIPPNESSTSASNDCVSA